MIPINNLNLIFCTMWWLGFPRSHYIHLCMFLHASHTVYWSCGFDYKLFCYIFYCQQLLQIVVAWLQFDWDNRKSDAHGLLKNIRFGVIPDHVISDMLGAEIEAFAKVSLKQLPTIFIDSWWGVSNMESRAWICLKV